MNFTALNNGDYIGLDTSMARAADNVEYERM